VSIRPAATVVLLRDGADGLEVWLQQRAATLAFAAGMYAFPGGALDPEDAEVLVPEVDNAAQARIWGDVDEILARTHLVAAARETHEESGVLLAPTALVPWSRWVTPEGGARRFDARFYVARCPANQSPRPLTGEVANGQWLVVRMAVDAYATGSLPMWPPTISTLLQLVPFDHVAAAVAAAPERIEAVT
jgi:8-oxo-dGTP pyrophosphatase MutT (NUDIX family)